jgi:hypothetical protein
MHSANTRGLHCFTLDFFWNQVYYGSISSVDIIADTLVSRAQITDLLANPVIQTP